MNFLFDNPLANMQGPMFLLLYGTLTAIAALVFFLTKSKLDWTANLPVPLIPQNPDPYQVAYLRGGENELIRTLVFSLIQKGFLKISNQDKKSFISLTEIQPNWTTLPVLERSILSFFQTARETREIFGGLTEVIRPYSAQYEDQMVKNQLLMPADVASKTRLLSLLVFACIALLGGYKFVAAIIHGRSNVMFLVVFTVVAFIVFWYLGVSKRLSAKGENFLSSIQTAFDKLQFGKNVQSTAFNSFDPTLLALGIFGTSVLVGSQYNDFEQAFHRASSSDVSSCGSSSCSSGGDGGSSCSSGGCSSGCGGCGGGCS